MLERVRRDARSVQTCRLDQSDERRRSLDGAGSARQPSPEPDRDPSAGGTRTGVGRLQRLAVQNGSRWM